MAVRYGSPRFTTDVDYSTTRRLQEIDHDKFVAMLGARLADAPERLGYDLLCRIQRHAIKPPSPEASFPTVQVSVGLARISVRREVERLNAGNAPRAISIDYSFNEWPAQTEMIAVGDGAAIRAYDLTDLLAEKYRALLQQEARNRARFQDVYDIYHLLELSDIAEHPDRSEVLRKLLLSSDGKIQKPSRLDMARPELVARSRERYPELSNLVNDPPDFDVAYAKARAFFEALPWDETS